MASGSLGTVLRHVETLYRAGAAGALTDGQLLERYRAGTPGAAEAAFAALVERHAGLVFAACRSVLGDSHDAEDAFQATFLVLARRAGAIREAGSVAGWLLCVARRISTRARARSAVRRKHERRAAERCAGARTAPESYPELYEEIDRLPDKFRTPVVLCDLEGHTYEQAAERLRLPTGTVQSRLARGRGRLRAGLTRRGLAPAIPFLAISPPPPTAVRAAVQIADGRAIAGTVSAGAARLASLFLRSRRMARLSMILLALASAGLVTLAAALVADPHAKAAAEPKAAVPADDGAVYARVVDARSRPMPGHLVHVLGGTALDRTFTTDIAGLIKIPGEGGVTPRSFMLVAIPDETTIGWLFISSQATERTAGTVANPLTITLMPRNSPVAGTLVDRAGRPIAGVRVIVGQMQSPTNGRAFEYGVSFPGWPIAAVTDEGGRYTIPLPADVQGGLLVHHRRFAGPWIGFTAERRALEPTTLDPAGSIVGVVTDAATGKPVAGATVSAQTLEHGKILGGGWGDTKTDPAGRFEIGGLAPGVYNLLFLTGPGGDRSMTAVAIEGVRVRIGEDTKADLGAIGGKKLRGTVIDPDTKAPIAGVEIGCYGAARPRSGAACMSTRTDAAGRFELSVPAGSTHVYIMDFHGRGRLSSLDLDVPEDRDPEPVRLVAVSRLRPAGGDMKYVKKEAIQAKKAEAKEEAPAAKAVVTRELPAAKDDVQAEAGPGRVMMGRVVDPRGRPIAGVRVYHNGASFSQSATDRDGDFVLEGLPPGDLSVAVEKQGYRPLYETVRADRGEEAFVLTPTPQTVRKPAPAPADLPRNLAFIDLQPLGNDRLDHGPGLGGNDLAELPVGVRKLGDAWFTVGPTMIHLRGQQEPNLPAKVEGIKVGTTCARLRFLHATQQSVQAGTQIGTYTVRYADRSFERIPIVLGADLDNWWTFQGADPVKPSRATVAWSGENAATGLNPGIKVHLFSATWTNPHPKKPIESIDFESAETVCDPFLVAATAEKE